MLEMKYNLSWDGFSEHLKKFMSDLYTSETYSDVTLVCDDQMKMKANKLVLRACSPIFDSILSDPHQAQNTIIFLRGINHLELESILQFVYLGETKIYQNRMEAFMTVAKDLQIKEIHNIEFNQDSNVEYETSEMENDENDPTVEEGDSISLENKLKDGLIQHTIPNSSIKEEKVLVSSETIEEVRKIKTLEKEYSSNQTENLPYKKNVQCNECEFTTSTGNLWRHKKTKHQGLTFQCPHCKYMTSRNDNLQTHIKRKHLEKRTQNKID